MFSLPPPHGATARGYAMPGYLSGERISKCMRVPLLGPPFFSLPQCFQVLGIGFALLVPCQTGLPS